MGLLDISFQGSSKIEKLIAAFDKGLDSTGILDEGSAVLYNRMRGHFLMQIDPTGKKWPPSQAALKRERRGLGGGTLYRTGRLWGSIQLYAEGPLSRAIGTNVPYAPFLFFGTRTMPGRAFLGFGPEDFQIMEAVAIKRIAEALSV